MISSIRLDRTHGVNQAPMNLGINVLFSKTFYIIISFTKILPCFFINITNIYFSNAAVTKLAAKSSTKRARKVSSDEDDSQQDLKPVKKKQMKQGSILDMMSKGEFLIE